MSLEEIADIRERLARMEERQVQLYRMVEMSYASFGDLANRVNTLEHLRTKVLLVAGGVGAIVSVAWDAVRSKLNGG